MRWLLAWAFYGWAEACRAASKWIQGKGRGPWAPPTPDFRSQFADKRVSANDDD